MSETIELRFVVFADGSEPQSAHLVTLYKANEGEATIGLQLVNATGQSVSAVLTKDEAARLANRLLLRCSKRAGEAA